jgi:hypothetical protein
VLFTELGFRTYLQLPGGETFKIGSILKNKFGTAVTDDDFVSIVLEASGVKVYGCYGGMETFTGSQIAEYFTVGSMDLMKVSHTNQYATIPESRRTVLSKSTYIYEYVLMMIPESNIPAFHV